MKPRQALAIAGALVAGGAVFVGLLQFGFAIPLIPAMGAFTAAGGVYRLLARGRSLDPRVLQEGGWR